MKVQPDSPHVHKVWLQRIQPIVEALPHLQRYTGQWVVIKCGGNAVSREETRKDFASCVGFLRQCGVKPLVVHGGGPQIDRMLERLGMERQFVDGLRVTSKDAAEATEMVLTAQVNKALVTALNNSGCKAVGLSGKDAGMITAMRVPPINAPTGNVVDLGWVGTPTGVDPSLLVTITESGAVPVVAPVSCDADGATLNINADTAAGAIAKALRAKRFLLLSDVRGVYDETGDFLSEISVAQARKLIDNGIAKGGMRPKLETCIDCVGGGVDASVILDGRFPMLVLLELFTDMGAGTLMVP